MPNEEVAELGPSAIARFDELEFGNFCGCMSANGNEDNTDLPAIVHGALLLYEWVVRKSRRGCEFRENQPAG